MAYLNPHFDPKVKYPNFIPNDIPQLQRDSIHNDQDAYKLSDSDFAHRHSGVVGAEKLFETQLGKDWKGENEFMPEMQAQSIKSGLETAGDSFGPMGSTLTPGSAPEASIATHLGQDIMGFQDRNRLNRERELGMAEQIIPRRTFGFGGETSAMLTMLNTLGTNNWNQAKYANDFAGEQYNYLVDAQNTQAQAQEHNMGVMANAQKRSAIWKGVFDSLGGLVGGAAGMASSGAGMCWVARAAFGEHDPRWLQFRAWLLTLAPKFLRDYYLAFGEQIGREVAASPLLQRLFRTAMLRFL